LGAEYDFSVITSGFVRKTFKKYQRFYKSFRVVEGGKITDILPICEL